MNYGLRATPVLDHTGRQSRNGEHTRSDSPGVQFTPISAVLDRIAAFHVPHGSFAHFYVASVSSSFFWALQLLSNGSLLQRLCQRVELEDDLENKMSMSQIAIVWSLLLIQGSRRLVESYTIVKLSTSRMWFIHWYLGVVFYLAFGVAIWIEGAGTPSNVLNRYCLANTQLDTILQHASGGKNLSFSAPSTRTLLCVPIFILASGLQHDCHAYLSSLPKYTLPVHPLFQNVICPHYTAECIIYTSMALIAAPPGTWINRTILCALIFVAVNLGVTASSTKSWYGLRFGKDKVAARWKLIPTLY